MAISSSIPSLIRFEGLTALTFRKGIFNISGSFRCPTKRSRCWVSSPKRCSTYCFVQVAAAPIIELVPLDATTSPQPFDALRTAQNIPHEMPEASKAASEYLQRLALADLDPATAKLAIGILGPFLSAFAFLFIIRIVMSWYPKLPVGKFPFVLAFAPTEPLLIPTRRLIPPVGGVDVTPVVWFGILSFLNEILVGPQGLLVLLSQQV